MMVSGSHWNPLWVWRALAPQGGRKAGAGRRGLRVTRLQRTQPMRREARLKFKLVPGVAWPRQCLRLEVTTALPPAA